ncbi:hypothetical protein SAMN04487859_1092 [Roseovarius lutimaris]|uniref:DUF1828 domain-containing protein n=1 Tax=Roseovarius lutimaris TaxID=1005928 RepID=A0A1I5BYI1_9RHOB|nr:hypothetical protein [Roseovarius lutimaris]SFN79391.1 hypothetical protein SAMN04487859_1092 [Roseovarius lutimaris]
MDCLSLRSLTARLDSCVESSDGNVFKTHCLYPSFSPVFVTISAWGDGFRVSDGGGASESVIRQGLDAHALTAALKAAKNKYHLIEHDGVLSLKIDSGDWIENAILAVANASAMAASLAYAHVEQKSSKDMVPEIIAALSEFAPLSQIATDYQVRGHSGKVRKFDVAVIGPHNLLFKAVSPFAGSVNSAYVAFSDALREGSPMYSSSTGYGVFREKLSSEDATLLNDVAILAPVASIGHAAKRDFIRHS